MRIWELTTIPPSAPAPSSPFQKSNPRALFQLKMIVLGQHGDEQRSDDPISTTRVLQSAVSSPEWLDVCLPSGEHVQLPESTAGLLFRLHVYHFCSWVSDFLKWVGTVSVSISWISRIMNVLNKNLLSWHASKSLRKVNGDVCEVNHYIVLISWALCLLPRVISLCMLPL